MIRSAAIAEEADRLRADLRQFMASRPDLGPVDLVSFTSLSECTGRNFLSGQTAGGRQILDELGQVLAYAKVGEILVPKGRADAIVVSESPADRVRRVPKSRQFYEIQTVRKVAEVLDYCAENCTIGIVTADFGAGKTEAVRAWRRKRGREVDSLIFEFDEFSSANKVDFVHQLAQMIGLKGKTGSGQAGRVFRTVCEQLRKNPVLLIFDQCETVRPRVFQVIRQIWDRSNESGVGVVILAAPILRERMERSRTADLGALQSRVGIWAPLSGIAKEEMAAIVKQEGLTEVDKEAFDFWWLAIDRSMRRLMRSIDLLRLKHSGKRISEKTIAGVAAHLWGMAVEVA